MIADAVLVVDFDDTLVTAQPHWIDVYSECLRKNHTVEGADPLHFRRFLESHRGATLEDFAEEFARLTGLAVDRSTRLLQDDLERAYRCGRAEVNARAAALLDAGLRCGAEITILTGGLGEHKRQILRGLGRPDHAELVIGFGDGEFTDKVTWMVGVRNRRPGARIAVVGDGAIDLRAARAAGAFFVGVNGIPCDCPLDQFRFEAWLDGR